MVPGPAVNALSQVSSRRGLVRRLDRFLQQFASQNPWTAVRDLGALKRGSGGLEVLSGGGIRGPGPMGRGARCRSHGEYGWRYTK